MSLELFNFPCIIGDPFIFKSTGNDDLKGQGQKCLEATLSHVSLIGINLFLLFLIRVHSLALM